MTLMKKITKRFLIPKRHRNTSTYQKVAVCVRWTWMEAELHLYRVWEWSYSILCVRYGLKDGLRKRATQAADLSCIPFDYLRARYCTVTWIVWRFQIMRLKAREGWHKTTVRLDGWRRVTQHGVILYAWWKVHATCPDGPHHLSSSGADLLLNVQWYTAKSYVTQGMHGLIL